MAKKNQRALPNGLTEHAKRERKRFEDAYEVLIEEVKKVSLTILVWGPNPESGSEVGQKRKKIRAELIRLGHNALFSEELDIHVGGISEKSKEFAQARAAHLIIVLVEEAPGALAETHDFCNDPNIAPNVFVMMPSKYRQGYSARGAIKDLQDAYGGVYWYKDGEIGRCTVLRRAVKRAEARRNILYRAGGQGK
jgi:hypothetical protein